MDNINWLNT